MRIGVPMSRFDAFAVEFGALIERFIFRKGWSREQIAEAVWGNAERKGHVTGYIKGSRGNPSAPIVRKFCDALDIPDAEIDALLARQREAAREQASNLNVPLAFLDRIAGQFGAEETFTDWKSFEAALKAKAGEFHRVSAELESLRTGDDRLANRIGDAEAALAEGRIEEAEAALADLREPATDRALEGLRQLARIMAAEGDLALLRGDADAAYAQFAAAADLFAGAAPMEAVAMRADYQLRPKEHGRIYGSRGLIHSAALLRANLDSLNRESAPEPWAQTQNALGIALQEQGARTGGEDGARLLAEAVAAYRAALVVRTRADMPANWAMTQGNIANALLAQAGAAEEVERARLLEKALVAVDGALEVFDAGTEGYYRGIVEGVRERVLAAMGEGA